MSLVRLSAVLLIFASGYAVSSSVSRTEPLPLHIEVSKVNLSGDPNVTDLQPASTGPCDKLTWLSTIRLMANGSNAKLFGGISGAFLNGSRLILVSDTTPTVPAPGMSIDDEDSLWGAGRLIVADLKLEEAKALEGMPRVLPGAVENATIQLLRNRFGDIVKHDYFTGDLESVDVEWPD